MSYKSYYGSGATVHRLLNDHRFKLYYLLFIALMIGAAVVAKSIGFPTVAGMLIAYIVMFSVISVLFVFVPILIIAKLF